MSRAEFINSSLTNCIQITIALVVLLSLTFGGTLRLMLTESPDDHKMFPGTMFTFVDLGVVASIALGMVSCYLAVKAWSFYRKLDQLTTKPEATCSHPNTTE